MLSCNEAVSGTIFLTKCWHNTRLPVPFLHLTHVLVYYTLGMSVILLCWGHYSTETGITQIRVSCSSPLTEFITLILETISEPVAYLNHHTWLSTWKYFIEWHTWGFSTTPIYLKAQNVITFFFESIILHNMNPSCIPEFGTKYIFLRLQYLVQQASPMMQVGLCTTVYNLFTI